MKLSTYRDVNQKTHIDLDIDNKHDIEMIYSALWRYTNKTSGTEKQLVALAEQALCYLAFDIPTKLSVQKLYNKVVSESINRIKNNDF